MLSHGFNLPIKALADLPNVLAGNWFSLLLPFVVYLLTEGNALRQGWPTMKSSVWRNTKILLCIYGVIFGWSIIRTVYQDHIHQIENSAHSEALRRGEQLAVSEREAAAKDRYQQLQIDCARLDGSNGSLLNQNRDQQTSINNCQTQAIKRMIPDPFKMTIISLSDEKDSDGVQATKFVLLSNKTITPVKLAGQCDREIKATSVTVLGSGTMGGGAGWFPPNFISVNLDFPAWSPTSPILLTVKYLGKAGITCSLK